MRKILRGCYVGKNPEELPCSEALCVEKYLMGYLLEGFSWGPMFERRSVRCYCAEEDSEGLPCQEGVIWHYVEKNLRSCYAGGI